jgi:O-antigen/teichoic acid export membrane protein
MLAMMPTNALAQLSNQVAYPLYSRTVLKGDPLAPIFRQTRWYFFLFAGWTLSGLIAGGQTIIEIMYDPRYVEAGWVVQLLAIGGLFNVGETVNSHALLALGQQRWNAIARTLMVVGMAIAIPVGYHYFGFPGAVGGFASAELFRFVVSGYAVTKNKIASWGQDVKLWVLTAVASGLAWVAVNRLHAYVHHEWVDAFVVLAVVSAVWAVPAYPVLKDFLAKRRERKAGGSR